MARIPEYDAPDRQIVASDKGANAFEQAGRRIGPAYNEAAMLQRQAGEARAAIIRQRRWPWDILHLERSLEGEGTSKNTSSGYGVKISGDINHLEHEREGGGSAPTKDTKPSSRSRLGNDVGATSMAAGALGKLASRMGATGQYHNSRIDPQTGIDQNLLPPMKPGSEMQLVNGQLVPSSKVTAFRNHNDINGEKEAEGFAKESRAGLYDDPAAAKKFRDKYGYDPNTGRMDDKSTYTGGNTPYVGGTSPNGDRYLSGSPSFGSDPSGSDPYSPDSSVVRTGAGSAPYDFWSDVTNGLGGVLNAGWNGEWPGAGRDYGGGQDTNDYTDLSGESGARDLSGER